MAGEDGNKKVGNIATEANSKTASIGVLNVLLTQLITGIITCKRKKVISEAKREKKKKKNFSSET